MSEKYEIDYDSSMIAMQEKQAGERFIKRLFGEESKSLTQYDCFNGTEIDPDKRDTVEILNRCAVALEKTGRIMKTIFAKIEKSQPNSILSFDIQDGYFFAYEYSLNVYKRMVSMSDSISVALLENNVIRMSFTVKDVWREYDAFDEDLEDYDE